MIHSPCSIFQIVNIVDFLGAAQEFILGIDSSGALAGRCGAGVVDLDANYIRCGIVAGHEEGLVGLALDRIGGDGAANVCIAIGDQDGEVANGGAFVVGWEGIDVGLLRIGDLVVPHVHGADGIGGCVQRIEVADPSQILASPLEAVRLAAGVVTHLTASHIEGGQIGQLVIPLHGGHAAGGTQFAFPAAGNEITILIVLVHDHVPLGSREIDQSSVAGTSRAPSLAIKLL